MEEAGEKPRRIRLADQPGRFSYKKGDKVVQRDTEGYADPEWAGVIVDGSWQGDPSGGAYTEDYWIQRDQGGYYPAKELTLLKRFDSDDELRAEIREKIRTYTLPRSMPPAPSGDLAGSEAMRSPQGRRSCSACGHRIRPGEQGAIEYEYADRSVYRFHSRCNAIWLEELRQRRLAPPSRS